MKIRNGFVSNSSSSSFVVLIPNGFKITDLVKDEGEDYTYGEFELSYNEYCEKLQQMIDNGNLYEQEELYNDLVDIFYHTDYILADIDVSSDSGSITIITEEKLLDKLKKISK